MPQCYLQDEFLRVFAAGHRATADRIIRRVTEAGTPPDIANQIAKIVREEVRGLFHGNLVVFDGGSSLADHGMIKIVDEDGVPFDRSLHETGFKHYDEKP